MSEKFKRNENRDRDEMTMARLLKLAGPRAPISKDIEARVFERVRRDWKASTVQPDRAQVYRKVHRAWNRSQWIGDSLRWAVPVAIAASALLAMAILMRPVAETPAVAAVGTVVKVSGNSRSDHLLPVGRTLYPGETVSTERGEGISLLLANAESLRVDENSALKIDGGNRFTLERGRLYADTGDFLYRARKLVIETPAGVVTDVGTQFSVASDGGDLEIAVREGRVDLKREDAVLTAVAGERVRLTSGSEPSIDRLEPHDPYWDWASSLAPFYDLENRSLLDFLRWASRETGRELVFEDQELRMAAMRTNLHGSVADFEPLQAIESILATTSFKYRIERDRIIIER